MAGLHLRLICLTIVRQISLELRTMRLVRLLQVNHHCCPSYTLWSKSATVPSPPPSFHLTVSSSLLPSLPPSLPPSLHPSLPPSLPPSLTHSFSYPLQFFPLSVVNPPMITVQPVSLTLVVPGQPATFTVTATDTNLMYQWQKNGTNVAGATSATYTIAAVAESDSGMYRCVVSNAAGSVTSTAVSLTVRK